MILSGKSLENFLKWNKENNYIVSEHSVKNNLIHDILINALIIEWFESECIFIYVYKIDGSISYDIHFGNVRLIKKMGRRMHAIQEAIIKANEKYNEIK